MNDEERQAVKHYQDNEMSFTVEYNKSEFLKAFGIEEKEEDSFENNQIRFKTLLNLIDKQNKIIDLMSKHIYKGNDFDNRIRTIEDIKQYFEKKVEEE